MTRQTHLPASSEDRMLGCFHRNATLCTSCHPQGCEDINCHGFTALDVAECHVGSSCDLCGVFLLGRARRAVS